MKKIIVIFLFFCTVQSYSQNQSTRPDSIVNLLVGRWDYTPSKHLIITKVSGSSDSIVWIEYNDSAIGCSSASSVVALVLFSSSGYCFEYGWNVMNPNWVCKGKLEFPITDTLHLVATCFDCSNYTLIRRAACTPVSFTQSATICAGQNFSACAQTRATSGTYTDVLYSYQGCDSIVTTYLTVLPANTFSQTLTICSGQNVTVGTNTYTASGTYIDTLVAINACDSIVTTHLTVSTDVNCPIGIAENYIEANITVYPNPTTGELYILFKQQIVGGSIRIRDVNGHTVLEKNNLTGKQFTFNMKEIAAGVYFIECIQNSVFARTKILKK